MTKKTAEKVADLLGLVEAILNLAPRPRKLPGKPRPEATDVYGKQIKVTKTNFWRVNKASLVGAIKLAAFEQGYSKRIRELAEEYIANYTDEWVLFYNNDGDIQAVDDAIWDTRELIRNVRAARKNIERSYGLVD